jgi:phage terminase large subunit GpA-like protein
MRQTDSFFEGLADGVKPKQRMSLSEWAEARLVLPAERSASPGPYRVGDATFQRGMMDAITDPDVEDVVFVTSSQVGKTTVLAAVQGYYADAEPSPQLSVFPTQIVADAYQTETFEPTVRDSAALAAIFDRLSYPGGYIVFVGANNPSQLAMRPIRVVTGDEVDRWPISAAKEGSPVELSKRRRTTYRNRKGAWASTPVLEDTSQIVEMFKRTRQHYFKVTCPHCDHAQILRWENVIYTKGREDDAQYACESCGALWDEMTKRRLVRSGEWGWLKESPFKCFASDVIPADGQVGFWICELYSPWSSMREMAKAWSEAEGNPELEQTFFNTRLGLPYKGDISSFADPEGLIARREKYDPLKVPKRAALLTAAADVQDDRIEVLTVAWGRGDECWILDHNVIPLDPSTDAAWADLARLFERGYQHLGAAGETLGIFAAAVDSGGHFTQRAYQFSSKWMKVGRRWHAIRGVPGEKKPIWVKSEQRFKDQTKLFLIGVDDAKTTVYTRYSIMKPGPGYIHIHEGIDEDRVKQMTAERAVTEYVNGFPKRTWEKPRHRRNEMLDLLVYNHAVRCSVNVDMEAMLQALNTPVEQRLPEIDPEELGKLYR